MKPLLALIILLSCLPSLSQKKINPPSSIYCDTIPELKKTFKINPKNLNQTFFKGGKFTGIYLSFKKNSQYEIGIYDCTGGEVIDSGSWNISLKAGLSLKSKRALSSYEFVTYKNYLFLVPFETSKEFIKDFSLAKRGIDKTGRGFKINSDMTKDQFIWHAIKLDYFAMNLKRF